MIFLPWYSLTALDIGKKSFAFSFTYNKVFNTLLLPGHDHPPSEIVKIFYWLHFFYIKKGNITELCRVLRDLFLGDADYLCYFYILKHEVQLFSDFELDSDKHQFIYNFIKFKEKSPN